MLAGSCVRMFSFVKTRQTIFPGSCTILHFYQLWTDSSCSFTSSLEFGVVSILDFGILIGVYNISLFNLLFFDDIRCESSFHMIICHLHIFFNELFVKVIGSLIRLSVLLLLYFKRSSYIWMSTSSHMSSVTTFCNSCHLSFHFLDVFRVSKLFNFNVAGLSIFYFMDCAFGTVSKSHHQPRIICFFNADYGSESVFSYWQLVLSAPNLAVSELWQEWYFCH